MSAAPPGPFRGTFQLKNSVPTYGRKTRALPKRETLIQCRDCKAIASGIVRGDRLKWSELPHSKDIARGRLVHVGCGGQLVAYDNRQPT